MSKFKTLAFSYYPNPTTDIINLKYSLELTSAKIINVLGQVLLIKTINATETELEMSNLTIETYLIEVTSGEISKTIKVVKR